MLGNFDCLACQWPASMHHPTQPPTKYPGGIRPKIKNEKRMIFLFFALRRLVGWTIGWDRDWFLGVEEWTVLDWQAYFFFSC